MSNNQDRIQDTAQYNGGTGVSLPDELELLELHFPGNTNNFPIGDAHLTHTEDGSYNFALGESFQAPIQQESLLESQGIGTPRNPNAYRLPRFHENRSLSLGKIQSLQNLNSAADPLNQRFQFPSDDLELGFNRLTLSSTSTNHGLTNSFGNRYDLTGQNFEGGNLSLGFERLAQQGTYMRNGYESGGSSITSNSPYQRSRTEYSRSYSSSPDPYLVSVNQETSFLSRNRFGHGQMGLRPDLRLSHLRGKIAFYATKEDYAVIWKHAMNKASHEEINMVFSEVAEADICGLCKKVSGSVLIKHLIEKCSVDQRIQILFLMINNTRSFFNICINPNGADVVMKLWMWLTSNKHKRIFLSAVSSIFISLPTNQDGLTFMMWSLQNFPLEHTETLLLKLLDASVDIAKDKHGCRGLKDLISQLPIQMASVLVVNIIGNAAHLSLDPYGNYVVQHVLETRDGLFKDNILNVLKGNYVALSFDKCGSHVVQKCLEETSREQSFEIIEEIISNPNVSLLLTHQFGNYVIQSALRTAKNENHKQYMLLKGMINNNYLKIHRDCYGKKVIDFCKKLETSWLEQKRSVSVNQL